MVLIHSLTISFLNDPSRHVPGMGDGRRGRVTGAAPGALHSRVGGMGAGTDPQQGNQSVNVWVPLPPGSTRRTQAAKGQEDSWLLSAPVKRVRRAEA